MVKAIYVMPGIIYIEKTVWINIAQGIPWIVIQVKRISNTARVLRYICASFRIIISVNICSSYHILVT